MYNKLFTKILDSSIWLEPTPTRIVWLTLIAVMDERGFAQFASVANVAHRARVTIDEAQTALTCFENPDIESSDPENDGKRVQRVPGGWMVLNAEKHRELVTRSVIQEQTRERVRRFRERLKRNSNADVTPSEAEAYTEARSEEEKRRGLPTRRNGETVTTALPQSNNGPAPLINQNGHKNHACCGRVCLHSSQFSTFMQLAANTPDPDVYVREFFRTWQARYTDGDRSAEVIGADAFAFWRDRWAETHPTVKAAHVKPSRHAKWQSDGKREIADV